MVSPRRTLKSKKEEIIDEEVIKAYEELYKRWRKAFDFNKIFLKQISQLLKENDVLKEMVTCPQEQVDNQQEGQTESMQLKKNIKMMSFSPTPLKKY